MLQNALSVTKETLMEVAVNARNLCAAPKVTRVRSNSHESDCGTQWTLSTVSEVDSARYLPTGSIENERNGEKDAEMSQEAHALESTTACSTGQDSSAQTSTRALEAATETGQAQPEVCSMKKTSVHMPWAVCTHEKTRNM